MQPETELTMLATAAIASPQSGRDARALLLSALLLSLGLVAAQQILVPLICALIFYGVLWRQWKKVWRRLLPINGFMIFLWLTLPLTAGSEQVVWLGLSWSLEGVHLALLSTLKANAIALAFMALLGPLGIDGAVRAFVRLKAPPKLTLLLLLTLRTIYQMQDHFSTALRALRQRQPLAAGWLHTWRGYTAVMARALVQSARRASSLQKALLHRGLEGALPVLEPTCWRAVDTLVVLVSAAAMVAMVML